MVSLSKGKLLLLASFFLAVPSLILVPLGGSIAGFFLIPFLLFLIVLVAYKYSSSLTLVKNIVILELVISAFFSLVLFMLLSCCPVTSSPQPEAMAYCSSIVTYEACLNAEPAPGPGECKPLKMDGGIATSAGEYNSCRFVPSASNQLSENLGFLAGLFLVLLVSFLPLVLGLYFFILAESKKSGKPEQAETIK